MRVACVVVPGLPLQALLRSDPELREAPLAVTDGTTLVEVTAQAARLGLRRGLTPAQARAVAPEAQLKARSPELERAARAALDDLAASFSPRVELYDDHAYLDVADLGRLFEHEGQIATALWLGARKLSLDVRVGIARDKRTARIAALAAEETQVVEPGREAAFLAPLPVGLLEPSPELAATLQRWGVRRIAELQTLPRSGVGLRLGKEGALLARVARGEAHEPLEPRPEPVVFEEGVALEWPVENVEALLFVTRRLVENVLARLACRGTAAGELSVELKLDRSFLDAEARAGGGVDARRVEIAAPTREARTLLELVRLELEQRPPVAPVTEVKLLARPLAIRPAQLGLFEPAGPSPDKLATLLARLQALVGADRVGAPVAPDRHLPDAYALTSFAPPKNANVNANVNVNANANANARPLTLHAMRPPVPAEARLDRGRLRYLSAPGVAGQVVQCAGPFRVRDGWWQRPVVRDYYDVELSDGAVYRVFQDLDGGQWHIDGCYE